MATQWTPGPWSYRPIESAHDTQRVVYCLIGPSKPLWEGSGVAYAGTYAKAADNTSAAVKHRIRLSDAECEANARLIAAAPALADLAQAVADHFADTDAPLGIRARELLALARGESQP